MLQVLQPSLSVLTPQATGLPQFLTRSKIYRRTAKRKSWLKMDPHTPKIRLATDPKWLLKLATGWQVMKQTLENTSNRQLETQPNSHENNGQVACTTCLPLTDHIQLEFGVFVAYCISKQHPQLSHCIPNPRSCSGDWMATAHHSFRLLHLSMDFCHHWPQKDQDFPPKSRDPDHALAKGRRKCSKISTHLRVVENFFNFLVG